MPARRASFGQLTSVQVDNCTVLNAAAGLLGGAFAFAQLSRLSLRHVAVNQSQAAGGGAISLVGSTVADIDELHVRASRAHAGGAVIVQESQAFITNSTFAECDARGKGDVGVGVSDTAQFQGGESLPLPARVAERVVACVNRLWWPVWG